MWGVGSRLDLPEVTLLLAGGAQARVECECSPVIAPWRISHEAARRVLPSILPPLHRSGCWGLCYLGCTTVYHHYLKGSHEA